MTKPDIINKKESYRPLFKTSKILKANDLYAQQALLFMINYEKKNLPDSFTNMFVHNRDICLNTTRESTHINTVRQRNNFIAHLPKSMLPRSWDTWTGNIDLTNFNSILKRKEKMTLKMYNIHFQSHFFFSF